VTCSTAQNNNKNKRVLIQLEFHVVVIQVERKERSKRMDEFETLALVISASSQ